MIPFVILQRADTREKLSRWLKIKEKETTARQMKKQNGTFVIIRNGTSHQRALYREDLAEKILKASSMYDS